MGELIKKSGKPYPHFQNIYEIVKIFHLYSNAFFSYFQKLHQTNKKCETNDLFKIIYKMEDQNTS